MERRTRKRKVLSRSRILLLLLADAGALTLETLASMADYRRQSWRKLLQFTERQEWNPNRSTLATTLWRLQKQGLISHEGHHWRLTRAGKEIANAARLPQKLPPKDGRRRILIFDIPETKKEKRDWLRRELSAYEYEPLQKSVWLGTRPIPQYFLKEAEEIGILHYIHIFEIAAGGTLD